MAHRAMTVRHLLIGAGLAAGLTAMSGPARAADDGYQNVFSSVLTAVGLMKPDAPPEIDYRERAPLALPPKIELRKPAQPGATRTAAWPQDPDVLRRKKADEEARAPVQGNYDKSEGGPLSKDELMKGRVARGSDADVQLDRCGHSQKDRSCLLVSPDELRAEGERYNAANPTASEVVTAGTEPEREYLTQPPKGYMKATRTVKATTEAPVPNVDPANPYTGLLPQKRNTDDE